MTREYKRIDGEDGIKVVRRRDERMIRYWKVKGL
jgi:hypothetical protein